MTPEEEKAALRLRGIGLTIAHIAVEEDQLIVSMCDYFEGESVSYAVCELENGVEGDAITGSGAENCNGKVAASDLKICKKDTTYPLTIGASARVKITYNAQEQTVDITPTNKSAWVNWTIE